MYDHSDSLNKRRPLLYSARRGIEGGGCDEVANATPKMTGTISHASPAEQPVLESETQQQSGTKDHHGGEQNPNGLGNKARKQTRCTVHRQDP